jgi:hypothetical protein
VSITRILRRFAHPSRQLHNLAAAQTPTDYKFEFLLIVRNGLIRRIYRLSMKTSLSRTKYFLNITKITHKFLHVSAEFFLCGKATLIFSFQFQFLPIGCSVGDTNEVNG